MENQFSYSPKYLTSNHIALLDKIILDNRQAYYKAKWRKSFFSAILSEIEMAFNRWIDKSEENSTKTVTMGLSINNTPRYLTMKILSLLGYKQSPAQHWLYKQTQRIREEVDLMMSFLIPDNNFPNEKLIENINQAISKFGIMENDKNSPLTIFTNKVKIDFLHALKKEFIISTNIGRRKKTNDKLKDGTTNQQIAVFYYLFECAQLNNSHIDNTKFADLISFTTSRSKDNIRKRWANIFKDNPKSMAKDLLTIRPLFEGIGANGIVEMIDRDLRG